MKLISTTQPTIKTQGNRMTRISLTHPATTAVSVEQKQEVLENYSRMNKDLDAYEIFILHAEVSDGVYKNPMENLEDALLIQDTAHESNNEKMDKLVQGIRDLTVDAYRGEALAYSNLSDEEKFSHDLLGTFKSEEERRQFLQLAMNMAKTSDECERCAILANEILDESESVLKLFKKSIELMPIDNSKIFGKTFFSSVEKTFLNKSQKLELSTLLEDKVRSLT